MEEEEKPKKYTSVVFLLATLVAVNLVVTGFLYVAYQQTAFELEKTNRVFKDLLGLLEATARYVAIGNISLSFTPYMPVQKVPPYVITYLLGFAQVSNLTNIVARPLTLTVQFVPNVTYPEHGSVTYEYTDYQSLEIPPGLDVVMMPWGAFPLQLTGFESGDVIVWDMEVIAICDWLGTEVTRLSLTVTFKLVVS